MVGFSSNYNGMGGRGKLLVIVWTGLSLSFSLCVVQLWQGQWQCLVFLLIYYALLLIYTIKTYTILNYPPSHPTLA